MRRLETGFVRGVTYLLLALCLSIDASAGYPLTADWEVSGWCPEG